MKGKVLVLKNCIVFKKNAMFIQNSLGASNGNSI